MYALYVLNLTSYQDILFYMSPLISTNSKWSNFAEASMTHPTGR